MAALGDSITVAYDATKLLTAQPEYSWSTGTATSVQSLYLRLKKQNRKLVAANFAVSGATMSDLAGQASRVPAGTVKGKELVTILMGANDVCTDTVESMTSVATFSQGIEAALATLATRKIDQVVVASIPNIFELWRVGSTSSSARFVWGLYGICQSMLENPTSLADADVKRRAAVSAHVVALNLELAKACSAITVTSPSTACRFDNNAVYNTSFSLTDISKVDYFHPSVSGQAKLAAVTYSAFGFSG
jgi:lysophospholipase L1-like esterase